MSFIKFRQRCKKCGYEWNAAFGRINNHIIAAPPHNCPACESQDVEKIADAWKDDGPHTITPEQPQT